MSGQEQERPKEQPTEASAESGLRRCAECRSERSLGEILDSRGRRVRRRSSFRLDDARVDASIDRDREVCSVRGEAGTEQALAKDSIRELDILEVRSTDRRSQDACDLGHRVIARSVQVADVAPTEIELR